MPTHSLRFPVTNQKPPPVRAVRGGRKPEIRPLNCTFNDFRCSLATRVSNSGTIRVESVDGKCVTNFYIIPTIFLREFPNVDEE